MDQAGRRDPGKIAAVLDLLEDYPDEVEADLKRFYDVRLRDLFRGLYTFREIHAYVSQLPMDAKTQTALRDDPNRPASVAVPERFGPWALDHYLTANLIDAVRELSFMFASVNRDPKGPAPTPPEPTPRPGASVRKVQALTPAGLDYINQFRAKG